MIAPLRKKRTTTDYTDNTDKDRKHLTPRRQDAKEDGKKKEPQRTPRAQRGGFSFFS
jgi:hypothetical protein